MPSVAGRGGTALVTGASSGIGEAFARALAAHGSDLVLVARSEDRMRALADDLRAKHGVEVTVLPADLTKEGETARVVAALDGRRIDLLVNNAGFGTHEPVVDEDPARVADEVRLNCGAVVDLTVRLLPPMVQRRRGGVIAVSSTSAFQPVSGMAVYGASKAFVLSFTEALWAETRGTGVRVLAVCPGPVETRFFEAAGKQFLTKGRVSAESVAVSSLRVFDRGTGPTFVPGLRNRLMSGGYRVVPRRLMARFAGRVVE